MRTLALIFYASLGVVQANSFLTVPSVHVGRRLPLSSRRRCQRSTLVASAGSTAKGRKALIAQNKEGAHGELGYHLVLKLIEKGISVTLLQDDACKNEKDQPFASYGNLENMGANIVWGDFSEGVGKLIPEGESFDYVFDNYAEDVSSCNDLAQSAKSWGVKNYAYVSSGSMYEDSDEVPLTETSDIKESGHRQVEKHIESLELPWTSFRVQYIYGALTNERDCLNWFFDRVVHGIQLIPIPLHGDQLVTVTHAEDVASMLASVVDNENAVNQVFNCASDRYISLNDILNEVAEVAQPTVDKVKFHYDPEDYDVPEDWFPFRNNHFFINSEKAKRLLGWKPKHTITDDLQEYFNRYMATGKDKTDPDFSTDDAINISWHHDYMPYMLQQQYRREDPNFDETMAEIEKTYQEVDRHHYSATLEGLKEVYREQFPDEPDEEAIIKAEYDAYMAAHPGLKEKLAQEEEEYEKAHTYTEEQLAEQRAKRVAERNAQPGAHARVQIEDEEV